MIVFGQSPASEVGGALVVELVEVPLETLNRNGMVRVRVFAQGLVTLEQAERLKALVPRCVSPGALASLPDFTPHG